MSDVAKRIADLSPEKRALLTQRLKEKSAQVTRKDAILPRTDRATYPLSFAQQRMWFLNQLEPDSPMYNIAAALRISGALDVAILERSLNEIVRRHEVLRARFPTAKGHPVQVIAPVDEPTFGWRINDLCALPPAEREAEAQRLAAAEAQRPFDLVSGPLFRVELLCLAEHEHILLLTLHHMVADGWSIGVLITEIATLYAALADEKPTPLPDLSLQYADFAAWQRQWLHEEDSYGRSPLQRQLDYWKQQLGDEAPVLELPTDRPRPAVQTFHGAHYSFDLPDEVGPALQDLSRQEETTLFMTLLAAFQVLLHRYSGQDDFCVGMPIANRNRAEIEPLIGFFVNTLVLRANFDAEPSFRELLRRVRETALAAYAHQDVPFEILVEELKLARDMSRTPLFQTMFVLQSAPTAALRMPGLTLQPLEIENGTAKFDLMLIVTEEGQRLRGTFEYNTDLFDATTIARLAEHFQGLLAGIVANPDQSVAALPLLSEAERAQLLFAWNPSGQTFPAAPCLHERFAAQAARTPDAIAVVCDDQRLTYAELNARANQLAHYLRAHGVGPEQLVALYLDRSLELIVAILGVLKAGGAYLPIDLVYPPERIAFMLDDAQPIALVTLARLQVGRLAGWDAQTCQPANLRTCNLDTDWPAIAQQPATDPAPSATPENAAYVIYTSGSTGQPKGVLVTHANVMRLFTATDAWYQFDQRDVWTLFHSYAFDFSVWEIWGALLYGGRLAVVPQWVSRSPAAFYELLAREQVTVLNQTPAAFRQLQQVESTTPLAADLALRLVIFGGEALEFQSLRPWLERHGDARPQLVNMYGITETTVHVTYRPIGMADLEEGRGSVIGQPIPDLQVYVLDGQGEPAPLGVAGELYVGGAGVARGYLNRPALTAARFLPDRFAPSADGNGAPPPRLYRTGDRARRFPNGDLEYLGRIDQQVKIRGFRIELGEIEAALNGHAQVRESAVLVREDTPGTKRLVAYVALHPADEAGDAEAAPSVALRQWLQPKLPDYMIPSHFVTLEVLPLTANGKLDRKALPAPDSARPDLAKAYVAPRTELERYLVDIWCDILGLKQVGVYDNFFELGGDSLQAAVLANRVQEELGVGAHVRSIFYAPTVADLSMYFNEYFPDTVAEKFGAALPHSLKTKLIETIEPDDQSATVDAAKIALIKQLVSPLLPRAAEDATAPSHPAVFILSPPRSGSTLLRVMLAGHPRLFAPPELELLNFNTLQERREAFSGIYEPVLEGTIRTLMEIHGYDVDTATGLMEEYERQNLSTRQFYALLQEWIGDRLLVDKTPAYSMDIDVLRRAEAEFANARYIHLVRHPYATIYSFVEAQLHEYFFRHPHPFAVRELAELIWTVSHQHVLEFRREIPAERYHRVMYEDLVSRPHVMMEEICQFLGIQFHPAMVKPYEGKRMTDGIRPMSQMVGDLKFYLRNEIDGKAAERWKRFHANDFLGEVSWQIAETLGYARQAATEDGAHDAAAPVSQAKLPALRPVSRDGMLALSFGQQRLWFLDQMEPGSPLYNIPAALRLSGALDRAALEQSLNAIVRRHEILRTSFVTVDGQPVQQIAPVLNLALPVTDLRDVPPADREAELQRLIAVEARRPFDLARGPLLRIRLFQLDEQDHVFCMTLHHIVADGWSSGVLVREIAALYPAFAAGRPSPLAPLAVQYADYAQWQREWLQSEMLNKQLAYWKRQLHDSPPLLELPTDRPRPAVLTPQGVRQTFALPIDLTDQLRALSQQAGATLFMTLTAAFQTLLARYSGQEDICIGTPVANRARAEIEPLIGFFVNTLVLRTDLSGDPSFRELLARVQRVAEEAYANADIPFEMLVDELQPERNLSHTPLFQVMIALNKGHLQKLELPDLLMSPLPVDSGTAKFDLTLALVERTDGLYGALEYNTGLFDAATIARMIEHFQILLTGIAANPNQPLSALPLLTETERRQLAAWNDTAAPFPADRCIHDLFAAQVERTPDALAVASGAMQLSYRELNARANQLAHYLRQLGVGPDRLVGLCVERSPEMIVGALGVLKAGGAYVPLDPDYPAERLAFMLEDAQPIVLLTLERFHVSTLTGWDAQTCEPVNLPTCNLDTDWPLIAQQPATNPDSGATLDNLAYVIYTSGSTGRPKGVQIEHRGLLNLIFWHQRAFEVSASDRATLVAGPGFDASVWETWPYLAAGASLHIPPDDVRAMPVQLRDWLVAQAVSISFLPTPLAEQVLNLDWPSDGALRLLLTGGDRLQVFPAPDLPFTLVNNYGPTESTVVATSGIVPSAAASGMAPTIGRPIDNTQLYILDRHGQPTPVGVPGELHIGGSSLARGYLNRPALTAERFVINPNVPTFQRSNVPTFQRLYKTGDLGRYRPDGSIEFLGRIDHQVKLRGFRIELGEIEAVLAQHPFVRETTVIVREDAPGAKRLVAYIVASDEFRVTEGAEPAVVVFRQWLQQKLPDYMVPAAFVLLEALPLTPNGKIDRKALPAIAAVRSDQDDVYVSPTTPAEATLARIWSEVLGVKQVGVRDNFFVLGGDSILSIQVISRANQAGLQLSPKLLFQYPTIAELAAVAGTARMIQAEQGLVTGPVPLTPIQHWFFAQDLPAAWHWNQAFLLVARQKLKRAPLAGAVQQLLAHHDALRLRFTREASGWVQFNVAPANDPPLEWIDVAHLPASEQAPAIEAAAADLQTSLNLAEGPLLRVAYFDLGPDRPGRLLLIIHHLAVDGVSWRILLEDLQTAYEQLLQEATVQLPPKTTSFQYWAQQLETYAQSEAVSAELPFWREQVEAAIAPVPLDFPNGQNLVAAAQRVVLSLSAEETRALLQDVPATYGADINDALLTALTQAIAAWTGAPAVRFDLEGHGREALFDDVDISRTVGWFTLLYPVRLELQDAAGPGEALQSVKEQLRQIPNRGFNYGLLRSMREDAAAQRAFGAAPAAEISFNYLGQFDALLAEAVTFGPAPESVGAVHSPQGQRSHLLTINGSISGGQLRLEWGYSAQIHRSETIERVAADFMAALRALIAHCQSPEAGGYTPSDFPDVALDQDDIAALLGEIGL
jgi:amino acid adenylation domain-containing protein/non-ribosomal peptide synthase protein (TIGR01720 family)